jgi:hypothetical protein
MEHRLNTDKKREKCFIIAVMEKKGLTTETQRTQREND